MSTPPFQRAYFGLDQCTLHQLTPTGKPRPNKSPSNNVVLPSLCEKASKGDPLNANATIRAHPREAHLLCGHVDRTCRPPVILPERRPGSEEGVKEPTALAQETVHGVECRGPQDDACCCFDVREDQVNGQAQAGELRDDRLLFDSPHSRDPAGPSRGIAGHGNEREQMGRWRNAGVHHEGNAGSHHCLAMSRATAAADEFLGLWN